MVDLCQVAKKGDQNKQSFLEMMPFIQNDVKNKKMGVSEV